MESDSGELIGPVKREKIHSTKKRHNKKKAIRPFRRRTGKKTTKKWEVHGQAAPAVAGDKMRP